MPKAESNRPFREGMDERSWVTRRGEKVPVRDLPDGHLRNALRIIQQAVDLVQRGGVEPAAVDSVVRDVIPCYEVMLAEVRARGMTL